MSLGYRTAARRCDICGAEADATILRELAGLQCCETCLDGDFERAQRHWGFELASRLTPATPHSTAHFFIEIKRPTFVEAFAKLRREVDQNKGWLGRLLQSRDPEVGDHEFDDQVLIAPDPGAHEAIMALLCSSGVRLAVLELVRQGCEVDLTGNSVWVSDRDGGAFDRMANMQRVLPWAMALAVHVERYARGERESAL